MRVLLYNIIISTKLYRLDIQATAVYTYCVKLNNEKLTIEDTESCGKR